MDLVNMPDQTPKNQLTPETYLGLARRSSYSKGWSLGGQWDEKDEYISSLKNSTLDFKFNAAKVFLVVTPATQSDIIRVTLDGKLLITITANEAKLYQLVDLPKVATHQLHLDFLTPGTKVYAFTFGD